MSVLWLISHSADTHPRKPPSALQLVSTTCQLQLMFPPVRVRTKTVPSSFICMMFIIASWLQHCFPSPVTHPHQENVRFFFFFKPYMFQKLIKIQMTEYLFQPNNGLPFGALDHSWSCWCFLTWLSWIIYVKWASVNKLTYNKLANKLIASKLLSLATLKGWQAELLWFSS